VLLVRFFCFVSRFSLLTKCFSLCFRIWAIVSNVG
jgi:hypothetical protein